MANSQFVFIDGTSVPGHEAWQRAVVSAGFDLSIDPTLKPFEDSGFLPCELAGVSTGVEIYYEPSADVFDDGEVLRNLSAGKDVCISFRWGSSAASAACAMILSYALAKSFGGRVSFEGDPVCKLDALLKNAQAALAEAGLSKRRQHVLRFVAAARKLLRL